MYVLFMFRDIYSVSYRMKRELYHRVFSILLSVFVCFISINLIRLALFYPVLSKSDSMSPDISSDCVVQIAPLLRSPERGQVMLVSPKDEPVHSFFEKSVDFICRFFTAQQYSPFSKNELSPSFRRVVGLPGDTIYISNHLVYIKPEGQSQFLTEFELTKIKYTLSVPEISAKTDSRIGTVGNMDQFTLKENEYFVLADNRLESSDSRLWGPVTSASFKGRALLIYFPFSKIKLF